MRPAGSCADGLPGRVLRSGGPWGGISGDDLEGCRGRPPHPPPHTDAVTRERRDGPRTICARVLLQDNDGADEEPRPPTPSPPVRGETRPRGGPLSPRRADAATRVEVKPDHEEVSFHLDPGKVLAASGVASRPSPTRTDPTKRAISVWASWPRTISAIVRTSSTPVSARDIPHPWRSSRRPFPRAVAGPLANPAARSRARASGSIATSETSPQASASAAVAGAPVRANASARCPPRTAGSMHHRPVERHRRRRGRASR